MSVQSSLKADTVTIKSLSYIWSEVLYVCKKTGKVFLMHETKDQVDSTMPVERSLEEYSPIGSNKKYNVYKKEERRPL